MSGCHIKLSVNRRPASPFGGKIWELILDSAAATLTGRDVGTSAGAFRQLSDVTPDVRHVSNDLGQMRYSRARFASRILNIKSKRASPSLRSPNASVIFSSR